MGFCVFIVQNLPRLLRSLHWCLTCLFCLKITVWILPRTKICFCIFFVSCTKTFSCPLSFSVKSFVSPSVKGRGCRNSLFVRSSLNSVVGFSCSSVPSTAVHLFVQVTVSRFRSSFGLRSLHALFARASRSSCANWPFLFASVAISV